MYRDLRHRGGLDGAPREAGLGGGGGVTKTLRYLSALVFVLAIGCTATPQPNQGVTACEDGVLKPCTCDDGSKSTQLCSGGTYDLCDCPENRVADGGGTEGDASPRADANSGTDGSTSTDGAASDTTGPAPISCQSDKDCKDAGKVCDPLTKQCVACLTDAECGPSQHCVGLACQGYTTCTNSLGCKAAKGPDGKDQPICDQTIGECSACLSAADCPPSHDCKAKQCLPFKTCQNSTECSKDEVCDKAISRCVQCLGDNDCAANQLCEQGKCNSFIPCSSDKQCTDKGLLCDQAKGKCAQCLGNGDCPGIYNCQSVGVAKTGLCVLDVCAQGQGACSNNQKVTCNAVGDGFGSPESCPAQTTCVAPGGKPSCKAWACTPGSNCQGDKAVECSADGLEVVKSTDCAAGAQKCLNGQCKSLLCEPATQYCDGNVVKQCAADGLSATPQQTCGPAEFCQNAQCKPIVCAPGQPACDGKVATTCNAQGSGYTGATVDCAAKGQVCSGGLCKQLVCDPQNPLYCDGNVVKQCDPGGLSATPLQTCGAAQYCDKGVCQAQVCTPGAPACNGTVKTTCNANGSGYVAGGTDCKASGQSCSAGQCVAQVCGNGIVDGTEQCDAAGMNGTAACSATCSLSCSSAWGTFGALPAIAVQGAITVEMWVKYTDPFRGNKWSYLWRAFFNSGCAAGVGSLNLSDGQVSLHGGAASPAVIVPAPSANAWHHLVGQLGATTSKLYVDGVLVGQVANGVGKSVSCSATLNYWDGVGSQPAHIQIASLRVSTGERYAQSFLPGPLSADEKTLILHSFQEGKGDTLANLGSVGGTAKFASTPEWFAGCPTAPEICTKNAPTCIGNVAGSCNSLGTGLATATDCATTGKSCIAGQCVASYASCKAALTANPAAQDGVYPIDPDGAGPIAAANLFCDMKNGGLTLVANIYDSAGDDAPNSTDYVVSGWQQTASGQWANGASKVGRDATGIGSAALSLEFVKALGAAAGQKNLKMCFVHKDGYDTTCRNSADGSLTLVSYNTGNPKLTVYSADKLTYTFGRLAGLAGGHNTYDYGLSQSVTYCIPKAPGTPSDGLWGGAPATNAICDHNCCNADGSPNDNKGVWAAWGSGASYRPDRTNDSEIGNIDGPNPSPSGFGFRLYIGP
jgi:hypothetical protein